MIIDNDSLNHSKYIIFFDSLATFLHIQKTKQSIEMYIDI